MTKKIASYLIAVFTCACVALIGASLVTRAQLWGNFPILGGASYCDSTTNNPATGQALGTGICVSTVPAGPAMTGLETIPGDTNGVGVGGYPSGAQTVKIPINLLGAGPYVLATPLTGASITVVNTTRELLLNPAGTLSTLTIVTPAASTLIDGQRFGLCTTQIISTLTITAGSGTTVNQPPTALLVPVTTGAASCVEWLYTAAATTWYRVQ